MSNEACVPWPQSYQGKAGRHLLPDRPDRETGRTAAETCLNEVSLRRPNAGRGGFRG